MHSTCNGKLRAVQHEKYTKYERQQSQISLPYSTDGYDYNNRFISKTEKKFDKPLQWVSVKQQFFNTTLIAKNRFDGGQIQLDAYNTEDTSRTSLLKAKCKFQYKIACRQELPVCRMQLYYGPNDYKILNNNGCNGKMDKIINLGQGIYSFVRPINQFVIMPVFNFLQELHK